MKKKKRQLSSSALCKYTYPDQMSPEVYVLIREHVRLLLPNGNFFEIKPIKDGIEIRHIDLKAAGRMLIRPHVANVVDIIEVDL